MSARALHVEPSSFDTVKPTCRCESLAQNGAAQVQRCLDCGCITVHMGAVSVRMDEAGLEVLHAVICTASARLAARQGHPPMHM